MSEQFIDYHAVGEAAADISTCAEEVRTATAELQEAVNNCIRSGIEGVDWANSLQEKLNAYAENNIEAGILDIKKQADDLLKMEEVSKAYENNMP